MGARTLEKAWGMILTASPFAPAKPCKPSGPAGPCNTGGENGQTIQTAERERERKSETYNALSTYLHTSVSHTARISRCTAVSLSGTKNTFRSEVDPLPPPPLSFRFTSLDTPHTLWTGSANSQGYHRLRVCRAVQVLRFCPGEYQQSLNIRLRTHLQL